MKIAIIGTGYVGLVAGACLAETGNDVICVDIDRTRIDMLNRGEIPIFEPGLETIVKYNTDKGRLAFTMDTADAVRKSKIIFLAVPTPMSDNGAADLSYIFDAAAEVAKGINEYKVIVDRSTVPPGTAAKVRNLISGLTNQPFDVISVPEFLKEGAAVMDFMKPDRVIIGCESERAEELIRDLYEPFVRTGSPIYFMSIESAEVSKYASNAFLATKISFMNEMARFCEKVGADVNEVRIGMGSDKRIGNSFLFPGLGFGGACFPKDLRALNHTALEYDLDMQVVRAAIEANERQKRFLPDKIITRFGENLHGMLFAVWGLAFKANTDDMRESPAIPVVETLLNAGAQVIVYDPEAMKNARKIFGDLIKYSEDTYGALSGADALVIATEWNEFRRPDFDRIKSLMKQLVIFDGRNLYESKKMLEIGFEYHGVGQRL